MSFGGQAPTGPAKELKRSPGSFAVAGKRCENERRRKMRRDEGNEKKAKGSYTFVVCQ